MENTAMKDLIIGGASGYDWEKMKLWVNSIKKSGFQGDTVLVATNITKATIDKLVEEKVGVALYGQQQPDGSFAYNSGGRAPHVDRFFYMWNHLMTTPEEYRYVVTTDVRDVIFQSDPMEWLTKNMKQEKLVCASEGMTYGTEPWGSQNYQKCFGPFFFELIKNELIYNVGTFGGKFHYVRDMLLMIFQMSQNRPIPVVDQAVFNFIINQFPYKPHTAFCKNIDAWAAQLGTTAEAIDAGAGDIGNQNPSARMQHKLNYVDSQIKIDYDSGKVTNSYGDPFAIVHQYDRIPKLKEKVEALYG
jgi:hypothetical protein